MASTAELRAVARAIAVAVFLSGCGRSQSERPRGAAPSATPSGARNPNPGPERFAAARAQAAPHWRHVELPNCAPLLTKPSDVELCQATGRAAGAVNAAISRGAAPGETALLASAAALAAQRASQALRAEGMRRLLEQRAAAPRASASAGLPPAAPPPQTAGSAPVRVQQNRDLEAIAAYTRIATLGLRELGSVLELAPLELRQKAFQELTRLAREEPHWAALRALVSEAFLVEADPELKQRLRQLKEQLGN